MGFAAGASCGAFTSAGIILVLFILLVIVLRSWI
ncbi:sporulation protein YjcZ [Paenibacillus cymbidii]|nr:sporulation protein YjcZ [Paenibacillus cymbidii]